MAAQSTSIRAAPIWAGLGLIALVTTVFHSAAPTNHDVAWILDGAGRLLDGGHFGRDVIDVNPPLAWWLAAIPVAFARVTGGSVAVAAAFFPALLTVASGMLAHAVLSQGNLPAQSRACLTLVACAFLMIAPGYDYGQREHLMLIASLPYLAAASVRAEGKHLYLPLAGAAGLLSAVVFCLKPWFLVIPLIIELWMAFKMRSLRQSIRAETVALVAVALGYVGVVLAFAPDYVFSVVPEAEAGYWAYDSSLPAVASNLALALLPSVIAAVVLYRSFAGDAIPAAAQAMFLASAGAFLAALLQVKGWSYQLLPATGFAFIGCTAVYSVLDPSARRHPLAAAAVMLLLVTSFEHSVRYAWQFALGRGTVERVERLAAVFRVYAGAGSVFAFITSPRDIHPAVLASGTRWVSASCCIYLLPAGLRADEVAADKAARAREAAQRQLAGVIALIAAKKPAVVIVDANRAKLGFGGAAFDYLPYLLRDARFALFWKAYAEREPVDGFRIFVRSG